jgi:hypothetical protein
LLEPKFILKVVKDLGITSFSTEEDIYGELRECARETMTGLVRQKLASVVNAELVGSIKTAIDPKLPVVAPALASAIERSAEAFSIITGKFRQGHLEEMEKALRSDFEKSLAADTWRKRFKGRDVLKRFCGRIDNINVNYDGFRNLVIAGMRDSGFQPEGMRAVIDKILAA